MSPIAERSTSAYYPSDAAQFDERGYLGPIPAIRPDQMADIREQVYALLETPAPDHGMPYHNRHLDQPLVCALAMNRVIVEWAARIFGPDLLLWRTNFFDKRPEEKRYPWHQDAEYFGINPPILLTAWLAIDAATVANGCIQVIPGSHRETVPHVAPGADTASQFGRVADERFVDEAAAVKLEMRAGEFVFFNERTLHASEANLTDSRRVGLAVRIITPDVKVLDWDSPMHGAMLLLGSDTVGQNKMVEPPVGF